jgi:methionine-S-sulfoxide reductase
MNRIIPALIVIAVLTAGAERSVEADTVPAGNLKTAVFAGGCFWCIQPAFDKTPGVVKTIVGYCGGTEPNPSYELVTSEKTNYRESLQVTYDPSKISFNQLLDVYWRQIDPTQSDGQFGDIGPSYRAAIFYADDEEKKIAQQSREQLAKLGKFNKPIATEILPAMKFWPAEDYHQQYYRKNPEHFDAFEHGSGRVSFKNKTWGEKDKEK